MRKPKRIQRKRTKGWRMPENAVYVGRPSKWGNPYRVGDNYLEFENFELSGDICELTIETKQKAVDLFRNCCEFFLTADMENLRGKDLACWCPLGQPCHADVLLELANSEPMRELERMTPC